MVDLKCKKLDCVHNERSNCFARFISVDRMTACNTYKKASSEKKVEFSDEITQVAVRPNVDVECTAHCVFNRAGACFANGISVLNEHGIPECSTFLPK